MLCTKGSLGLGSVKRELIDNKTFEIVKAGDHWSLSISRQMAPALFILQWYIRVRNVICTKERKEEIGNHGAVETKLLGQ